jgi:hypothetical protein
MAGKTSTNSSTQLTKPRGKKSWRERYKGYVVPAILAIYLNVCLLLWGWVLLDVSTGTLNIVKWFGLTLPVDSQYVTLLKLAFYAAIGGAIGGIVFSMQNLWKYVTKGKFKIVFAGDYFLRQFGAATLAVVVFALIRGGILTALGTDPATSSTTVTASFSAFAIGFLSGFGSYQVIRKLDELIKKAFGKSDEQEEQDPPNGKGGENI